MIKFQCCWVGEPPTPLEFVTVRKSGSLLLRLKSHWLKVQRRCGSVEYRAKDELTYRFNWCKAVLPLSMR